MEAFAIVAVEEVDAEVDAEAEEDGEDEDGDGGEFAEEGEGKGEGPEDAHEEGGKDEKDGAEAAKVEGDDKQEAQESEEGGGEDVVDDGGVFGLAIDEAAAVFKAHVGVVVFGTKFGADAADLVEEGVGGGEVGGGLDEAHDDGEGVAVVADEVFLVVLVGEFLVAGVELGGVEVGGGVVGSVVGAAAQGDVEGVGFLFFFADLLADLLVELFQGCDVHVEEEVILEEGFVVVVVGEGDFGNFAEGLGVGFGEFEVGIRVGGVDDDEERGAAADAIADFFHGLGGGAGTGEEFFEVAIDVPLGGDDKDGKGRQQQAQDGDFEVVDIEEEEELLDELLRDEFHVRFLVGIVSIEKVEKIQTQECKGATFVLPRGDAMTCGREGATKKLVPI